MCYGSQEYFISCRHPGNFHVSQYCHNYYNGCQARIEEQTIHLDGFCPGCQHTAYTEQPRGRVDRPRDATAWRSFQEMADHYTRMIDAAEERLADAQYYYDHNPHGRREGVELRNAQQDLEDAKRGWDRDRHTFMADETADNDRRAYDDQAYYGFRDIQW